MKTHRTWVIAPDAWSLERRWEALQREKDPERKEELFHPDRDRTTRKIVGVDLGPHRTRSVTVANDGGPMVGPVRYAFRSFDRQWIVPDHRLLSRARSDLWLGLGAKQVYVTALEAHSPTHGPAITLAGLIPDNHHYKGSFAGRAYPLWRDRQATVSNISPALLGHLARVYGHDVGPEDMMAYLAAVMANPAYTKRFAADLVQPGLRVPLTAEAVLFDEAAALGREVVWLQTYGERFGDPGAGRPRTPPRLPRDEAPFIPAEGAIPTTELPETIRYEAESRRLHIGKGFVENVPPEVWAYEISGRQVVPNWFSYRKSDRSRPLIAGRKEPSKLDLIKPNGWLAEYTTDLLDLLHVLGRLVKLEAAQADLLDRVCAGRLITVDDLRAAGVLATEPVDTGVSEEGADDA